MKPLFKPEDFPDLNKLTAELVSNLANAKFERWLKRQKKVYCCETMQAEWYENPSMYDTHTARIVDVRKMK